ncbi:MotA/TolQ/ExbB proton channel family protein [Deinococcus radiophilus]|uniref:MotA/TolQ/ExbB proton channel family protein n=1 Tax=Deinococcus radiophilus TaxID=32062 RepID=A0A431W1N5_9DEIO|nr:MotA/TolQ/ExbB proton channel family protein [Deinococcus radiophilus]RTR29417.1 MotA/TolQ/ExbB proton channel family protein [Deinococcus radiophilus]UFA50755.1 MotA/TolQ/ExbB proton channel family protein [Deinococcus radiophilus]
MTILELLTAAGPLFYVLIALSVYVLFLAFARAQTLARLGQDPTAVIERARATTAESGPSAALAELDYTGQSSPVANVMRAGLARADWGPDAAGSAMNSALLAEDSRLYAGLSALGTAAQIAPLLGLLGTVIGMVRSFLVFSATTNPSPTELGQGISEALINTAGGLVVAIIAYVARNALRSQADRIAASAERVREELPGWLSRPGSLTARSTLPSRAAEAERLSPTFETAEATP